MTVDTRLYALKQEFDKPMTDEMIDDIEFLAIQCEIASYKNMERRLDLK
jgi:hypothetical protein